MKVVSNYADTATRVELCLPVQVCTHVFVNIDGDVEYDDPLLEVSNSLLKLLYTAL